MVFAALMTNSLQIDKSPSWLSENTINKVAAKIESRLEWSIQRINGKFYKSLPEFESAHGYAGSPILAFYRSATKEIHFGPGVTKLNFEATFAHELAHAVVAQKFQSHLPKWLEEGLANWASDKNEVDWSELAKLFPRMDPKSAAHPFTAQEAGETRARYTVSLAALQFLKKQCPSFRELLNLSLKSNLEDFLASYCKIQDLKTEFWKFVDRRAKLARPTQEKK
jgi:hypothetical protein